MDLNLWKESGKFVDAGGCRVFCKTSGAGDEILLCLHGFPAASWDYHKIWDALAARFTVAAFDMIGYGFSEKPVDFGYTTFDQTDVLEAFVEKIGARRVHILAHDYGNTITQELLARRSEGRLKFSIESICMLNGALFPETHRPILAQKLLISPIGAVVGRLIPDAIFKRNLALVFGAATQPSDSELDDYARLLNFNGGKRIFHLLIRYMTERTTHRERWVGALETIDRPFRMINGLDDQVSGRHLVARFRELFPRFEDIVEIEGVGHFPHLEAPQTVLSEYVAFRERADG